MTDNGLPLHRPFLLLQEQSQLQCMYKHFPVGLRTADRCIRMSSGLIRTEYSIPESYQQFLFHRR